jgi:paraquat-inducible protein B
MARNRATIVGGFVLGALALVVAAILFFSGSNLFERRYRAVVFFENSVAGLGIGAPVTFRGVQVGSVQHIELQLSSSGHARIPVVLEFMPEPVSLNGQKLQVGSLSTDQLVKEGLRAQLNLQSFVTGQLRVDLDFLPNTPVHLEPVDTGSMPQIPALPSDLERLRASLSELPIQELSQRLLGSLQAIERLANHLDARVDPLLGSVEQGFDTAARTMEVVQTAIGQLRPEISHTLENADTLLTDTTHQIDARSADIAHLVHSADRVTQQANVLLSTLNNLAEPGSEFRGNLDASMRDLAATAASLRELARTLDRDPSVVLRGRSGQ